DGGGGGGVVLPATDTPYGYSLQDMAAELAYFSTGGNDPQYYPDTPFQILYDQHGNGKNVFYVNQGTSFFVPVAWVDDSPPVLGDFPTTLDGIPAYVFGQQQLGGRGLAIIVDGRATKLGPAYAVGVHAPDLLDGGGSNYIQVGAFLTPLAVGKHTVTIQG